MTSSYARSHALELYSNSVKNYRRKIEVDESNHSNDSPCKSFERRRKRCNYLFQSIANHRHDISQEIDLLTAQSRPDTRHRVMTSPKLVEHRINWALNHSPDVVFPEDQNFSNTFPSTPSRKKKFLESESSFSSSDLPQEGKFSFVCQFC